MTVSGVWPHRAAHPRAVPRLVPLGRRGRLALQVVVAVALVPVWLSFLSPRSLGGPVSLVWVSGTSMQPTLHTGDLSILYRRTDYDVGDVVAFDIPEGGTVIHRVIEVQAGGYQFQGDNRELVDPWILDETAIHGRQLATIPQAARALAVLQRPEVMAALAAGLVFVWFMRRPSPAPAWEGGG